MRWEKIVFIIKGLILLIGFPNSKYLPNTKNYLRRLLFGGVSIRRKGLFMYCIMCHDTTAMLLVSVGLPLLGQTIYRITTPTKLPIPAWMRIPLLFTGAQSRLVKSQYLYIYNIRTSIYVHNRSSLHYITLHYIQTYMVLSHDRVPRTWFILIIFPNFQWPFHGSKISHTSKDHIKLIAYIPQNIYP